MRSLRKSARPPNLDIRPNVDSKGRKLTMSSFVDELADKAGLENAQAHQGVGALLALLKDRLDPDTFAHLQKSIPNASDVLAKCQAQMQDAKGSLFEKMKEATGKLFSGNTQDAAAAMQSHFGNFGLSADHVRSLLPAMSEMPAKRLPPDVLRQIREHVPGLTHSEEETIVPSG